MNEYLDIDFLLDETPVQQVQGKRVSKKRSTPGGSRSRVYVPDDQWKIVLDKELCWQCYTAGHRRGDNECKEKGKPKRMPTAEDLKA